MEDKRKRMEELVARLNRAGRAYYQESRELISNQEYDELYDELQRLETETGIVLANSPTVHVGYEVISNLPKEQHPSPMLSLDKTKEVGALESWLGDKEGLLSWKLDGLTIVLTYQDGKLSKAVTRGDGITGEVITSNARVFDNIPLQIPQKDELVVRGEAVITYADFEEINKTIGDADAKYKNPRNLCSGTVRQLNNEITAQRHVKFYAFSLAAGGEECQKRHEQLELLQQRGFETVEYVKVTRENIADAVADFEKKIADFPVPSDGLVLIYDDIAYGRSLGSTSKFPRDSIAFKWMDEQRETTLKDVLWNVSRTGLINPIAVFDPVELEGTTVSRASVHNLSIVRELALGTGDTIKVYKANMIIPQIAENLTRSGSILPPEHCPVCGSTTEIKDDNGVETLHCPDPDCPAKRIKSFTHFVSRNALNIEGLSEATLEKFIDEAMIREFADIFKLERFQKQIVEMEGFGEKSFENLIAAAKAAHADHFIRTLPGGYQMELNEDATNVSQGQKQLLTIARAILADNPILILDEATSSVDTRTEIQIQKAMNNLMKGRTSFVIAHRLSTIRDADVILVMKDGDIAEQGTHEELLAKGGFYAQLYNSQFEKTA